MSWYWIVLIGAFYVLLSAVTCVVLSRATKITDGELIVSLGIFWPLLVIALPIIMLIILLEKLVDKYGYKEK